MTIRALPYQAYVALKRARGRRQGARRLRSMYAAAGAGDLVFDVGANVGDHIELFRSQGCRVVAVEPQPHLAAELVTRYSADPSVTIVPRALASAAGTGMLQLSSSHVIASMSSEFREAIDRTGRFGDAEWTETVEVETTTLDALVAEHGRPAFCKLDVEGYELEVLGGLSQSIPVVVLEYTHEVIGTAVGCVRRLAELGSTEFGLVLPEASRLPRRWLDAATAIQTLEALPAGAYGDLYARAPR